MESRIYQEAFAFANRVVKAYIYLTEQKHEYEMSKQLKRCGTSISANLAEARYAQSKSDWISKVSIALKEANESRNWIELLHENSYIEDVAYQSILKDCNSLIFKLASMIRSAKKNSNQDKD